MVEARAETCYIQEQAALVETEAAAVVQAVVLTGETLVQAVQAVQASCLFITKRRNKMNFAVLNHSIVENIIVCDSLEVAEAVTGKTCVEYTDANPAHIGLGYDGTTFEQPPLVVVEEPTE
jgi:hypothetical protein